ncbi:putative ferric-chelate reductase 1 homolog isoform X2 [Leptinotarsa decemlineata]|uniref:putative ferric-chelate reductase 1 homolog isoform X2 n=1 Tax=Leptinotarsa decemlineata TaxID=7539 RepID=UPI003D308567
MIGDFLMKISIPEMILLLFLIFFTSTNALPQGAPTSVCQTMMPFHQGGIPAQPGLSPYSIVTRQHGDKVQVSVGSSLGVRFQGFMLQGRTPAGEILGTFQTSPVTDGHTINCADHGDTVTHSDTKEKDQLDVTWVPPVGYEGPIVFNSTVAQNYNTFWVGIESPTVQVSRRSTSDNFGGDPFYAGCFDTKYCFGAPEGCVQSQNCRAAVVVTSVGGKFVFDMKADRNAAWVGVGLSQDARMGNDSVIECVKTPNGRIEAFMAWTSITPYSSIRLSNPYVGIQLLNASISGDTLYCSVERSSQTTVNDQDFDLTSNTFHVLVASGSSVEANSVGFHDLSREASAQPVSLLSYSSAVPNTPPRRPFLTTPPYFSPEPVTEASTEFDPFYDGCGDTKLCFGTPVNCDRSKNCKAVVAVTVTGDKYDFEMKADRSAAWVGVGLSDDDKMGRDSVIECVKAGNGVETYMSWTGTNPYRADRLSNPRLGIELLNASVIDGVIYCKVRRNVVTNVNGVTFNLVSDVYNILIAAGSSIRDGSVGFHDIGFLASGEARALSDTSEVGAASKLLVRLHGSLMLAAWIGTASLGILLARYYRQTWVGTTMMGKDLWFAWHRVFMVLTWSFTLVAFVLIFVELKAWSAENNPHAILGTITTILCFFQPIGAYFRPHPGTSKRSIFNWAHWLIGNTAHIIAIVTLFFAVTLTKAELPKLMDYILVAYVVVHVISHLLLSVLNCISEKSSDSRVSSFPMKDLTGSGRNSAYADQGMDAPFSTLRKIILGVYILVILLLTIALIIITALAPIETTFETILPSKSMN